MIRFRVPGAEIVVEDATATVRRIDRQAAEGALELRVLNKVDLVAGDHEGFAVSALAGTGMAEFRGALDDLARRLTASSGPPVLTRARHRACVGEALLRLEAALAASWPELRGEDLRLALRALGRLSGAVGVEDVLDSVFRQFCIGK